MYEHACILSGLRSAPHACRGWVIRPFQPTACPCLLTRAGPYGCARVLVRACVCRTRWWFPSCATRRWRWRGCASVRSAATPRCARYGPLACIHLTWRPVGQCGGLCRGTEVAGWSAPCQHGSTWQEHGLKCTRDMLPPLVGWPPGLAFLSLPAAVLAAFAPFLPRPLAACTASYGHNSRLRRWWPHPPTSHQAPWSGSSCTSHLLPLVVLLGPAGYSPTSLQATCVRWRARLLTFSLWRTHPSLHHWALTGALSSPPTTHALLPHTLSLAHLTRPFPLHALPLLFALLHLLVLTCALTGPRSGWPPSWKTSFRTWVEIGATQRR